MLIRPHHALCAQFFEGKGYSERFVGHMYQILADRLTEVCQDCEWIALCSGKARPMVQNEGKNQ